MYTQYTQFSESDRDLFSQYNDLEDRVRAARANAPRDILTRFTRMLVKYVTSLLVVFTPFAKVTSAIGGCLIVFTIGFLSFLFALIWLPMYRLLIWTSWLWIKAWYLRLLLLFPGFVIAFIADMWVMFTPDFRRDSGRKKRALCEEWPLSWYINSPPKQSVV
jgi:hypothetical protein